MGINQLTKLIKEFAPLGLQIKRLKDFSGGRLAIDVSNYMYQFAYNPAAKKPNYHLAGFFELACLLASHKITPVFVFDGEPTEAKSGTLQKRKDELARKVERIDALNKTIQKHSYSTAAVSSASKDETGDETSVGEEVQNELCVWLQATREKKNLEKQLISVTSTMWTELRHLFKLMDVPFIYATEEADLLSSCLMRAGLVNGVVSEDMDHLTFGVSCLVRDLNNKKTPDLIVFDLEKTLDGLGMTQPQFVDMCILCGCDYVEKIAGIGYKNAYRLIKKHGSIEEIVSAIEAEQKGYTKFTVPTRQDFDFQHARMLFTDAEDTLAFDETVRAVITTPPSPSEELSQFLQNRCNYRESTLTPKIKALKELSSVSKKTVIKTPKLK